MICDDCHENEARIHVRKIIGDKVKSINLCEACAAKHGLDKESGDKLTKLVMSMTSELLAADIDDKAETSAVPEFAVTDTETPLICDSCGLTMEEFSRSGRFGCARCYEIFERIIIPVLKTVHRGERHYGRAPGQTTNVREKRLTELWHLRGLREELARAITTEAYEQAARLRDEIQIAAKCMEERKDQ